EPSQPGPAAPVRPGRAVHVPHARRVRAEDEPGPRQGHRQARPPRDGRARPEQGPLQAGRGRAAVRRGRRPAVPERPVPADRRRRDEGAPRGRCARGGRRRRRRPRPGELGVRERPGERADRPGRGRGARGTPGLVQRARRADLPGHGGDGPVRLTGQGLKGMAFPLTSSLIFITVTVMATALLASSITGATSGDRVTYHAKFTDVAGLHPGHGVRIAGVEVGQVEKIEVTDRRLALVTFEVDRDREIPASATAAVKYLNLVGGRYIALDQGTGPPGEKLPPGGTIPVQNTSGTLNLTQLFQGFQPLMQALSPGDANKLSESIVKVLQGEAGTVESLNSVVQTINSRDRQLVELVGTLREFTSGLAADRKPIGEAIASIADLTTATAGLLQVTRDPLKDDIVQLGRLSDNLNRDAPLVERFLKRTPTKLETFGRLASYGSWMNFYQCEVKLVGVRYAG